MTREWLPIAGGLAWGLGVGLVMYAWPHQVALVMTVLERILG